MSNLPTIRTCAAIFGCKTSSLLEQEAEFFSEVQPWGFILFRRNIENPDQLVELTRSLRSTVAHTAPIFIDQEGGRVARMLPPYWRSWQPVATMIDNISSPKDQEEALYLRYRWIANELRQVGIDANCAPLLDIRFTDTHRVIADRTLGRDKSQVTRLGRILAKALLDGGVLPVAKHVPGHGRAISDSHKRLPRVDTDIERLKNVDFMPFCELSYLPVMMSAHILYSSLDDRHCATLSNRIIEQIIRRHMRFDGLLISDDLAMSALGGSIAKRATATLTAGCDIALYCRNNFSAMQKMALEIPKLGGKALKRAQRAQMMIGEAPVFDEKQAAERLHELGVADG